MWWHLSLSLLILQTREIKYRKMKGDLPKHINPGLGRGRLESVLQDTSLALKISNITFKILNSHSSNGLYVDKQDEGNKT